MANYKIPLFDLNINDREAQAVVDTIKSNWISTGPKCEEFEELFSKAFGTKYALTAANCTAALHLAVKVLGIKEGDEVIVPSLSFAATANCVTYVGAQPIFADVNSCDDLTISPEDIQKKITSKTKAIIVMHYAGFPCRMDEIMAVAKKNNLFVIEDACHAPLSEYKGKTLGTFGDVACYSFFSNKNMSTGEGGMLVTNNKSVYDMCKLLRSHGMTSMSYQRATGHATEYDIKHIGYNYRMDDMRAAMGIVQLDKLSEDLAKRKLVREWYLLGLKDLQRIVVPFLNHSEFSSNYIFPVVLKESNVKVRDMVRESLHKAGVQTSVHYPSTHKFSCYEGRGSLPITEYISDNEITLPMYGRLCESDVAYICETLKGVLS